MPKKRQFNLIDVKITCTPKRFAIGGKVFFINDYLAHSQDYSATYSTYRHCIPKDIGCAGLHNERQDKCVSFVKILYFHCMVVYRNIQGFVQVWCHAWCATNYCVSENPVPFYREQVHMLFRWH